MNRSESPNRAWPGPLRLAKRALVSCGTFVLLLLVAELALRVSGFQPRYLGQNDWDDELGFHVSARGEAQGTDDEGAFLYYRNDLGYRARPYPAPDVAKDAGVRRILFVGDSFLQTGVREELYLANVVERELAASGVRVECYTASTNGFGTAQEILLARRAVERVKPDLICLMMFPHNDVANNSMAVAGVSPISPGDYVRPYLDGSTSGAPGMTYLHPGRALARRLSRLYGYAEIELLKRGAIPFREPQIPGIERRSLELAPRSYYELYHAQRPARWNTAMRDTERLVLFLRDECRTWGADFVVGVIPSKLQVQHDFMAERLDLDFVSAGYSKVACALDLNLPERWLRRFFAEQDIRAVCLLEPLRQQVSELGKSSYLPDGHLNGRGHERAGTVLARVLDGGQLPVAEDWTAAGPTPVFERRLEALSMSGGVDFMRGTQSALLNSGWAYFDSRQLGDRDVLRGWVLKERKADLAVSGAGGLLVVQGHLQSERPGPYNIVLGESQHEVRNAGFFELHELVETLADYRRVVVKCNRFHSLLVGRVLIASPRTLLHEQAEVDRLMVFAATPLEQRERVLRAHLAAAPKSGKAIAARWKANSGSPSDAFTRLDELWELRASIEIPLVSLLEDGGLRSQELLRQCFQVLAVVRQVALEIGQVGLGTGSRAGLAALCDWALELEELDFLGQVIERVNDTVPAEDRARLVDLRSRLLSVPQSYGTELVWVRGEPVAWFQISDEAVEENRRKLGLGPLAAHIATERQRLFGAVTR